LRTALDALRRGEEAPRAPVPRLADLGELVDGVRASGLDVRVERSGPVTSLPGAVELAAYRIVQEALTNVTRHARARTVTVRLAYDDGVTVEVTDDGIGGSAPVGNGIMGMRERAATLGGTVDAGPRLDGGFRVVAHLPVPM
jgi:signal transduction histidine kinase